MIKLDCDGNSKIEISGLKLFKFWMKAKNEYPVSNKALFVIKFSAYVFSQINKTLKKCLKRYFVRIKFELICE